jgi:hypothetical protein
MPLSQLYQNDATKSLDRLTTKGMDYRSYLQDTTVSCKAIENSKIFASAEGDVFSCCWTGGLYSPVDKPRSGELWDLLNSVPGGKDSLNAKRRPLRQIVEGPFFQRAVPATWTPGSRERQNFGLCARACGTYDVQKAIRA